MWYAGAGGGDRSAGDSVRNLFAPQLQLDEREIQKPSVFGGVLFHISFAVERNMAAGGRKAGHGCNPQSENGKRTVGDAGPYGVCPSGCGIAPPEAWKKNDAGRRGRRPLRRVRPETWRDTCGRGVPIGGVQTRDAGAGGVFRRSVIDRCGPSGRRIQNYVGCKALPLYGAREESFRAVRRSGSGDGEYKRFTAEPLCTAVTIGRKGNPKTVGFWRRSFPYFFRC